MPTPFEPWLTYPSLTRDHMREVGLLMRNVRDTAARLYDPESGDGPWSLGCRIYERTLFALRAASLVTPWLSILEESHNLRFTFAIGPSPVKFYRGDPDEIPGRSLRRSYAELHQLRLAFELDGTPAQRILRLAVEADSRGMTQSISLVEVDEQDWPARLYEIPLDSENVVVMRTAPINLAPPALEVIEQASEESRRAESGANRDTTGPGA